MSTTIFGKIVKTTNAPAYPGSTSGIRLCTMNVLDSTSGQVIENLPMPDGAWAGMMVQVTVSILADEFNPDTLY
jgi:hypothetical protein